MDAKTQNHELISRDVQTDVDDREVYLHNVGISDLRIPLKVSGIEMDEVAEQDVAATCTLAVDLAAEVRGIHMSRLVEDLGACGEVFTPVTAVALARRLRESQESANARVDVEFDYFLAREAPVSGRVAKQAYRCRWSVDLQGGGLEFRQEVEVPVTTLCPCSKEISAYGAHNQRGYVDVVLAHRFEDAADFAIEACLEDIIEQVEDAGSAPLYPILKRVDERHVTMQAFDNPCFVEDLSRNVVVKIRNDKRFDAWQVTVTNHESIHQHNAMARVQSPDWQAG